MRAAAAALALLAACSAAGPAGAAGLYFSDRGVHPLSRGGAFVAGADDLNALWYNPAGLVDAGSSILTDMAWLRFTSEYTRRTQVADASGALRVYDSPTVSGTTPFLPIPTLAGSFAFGPRKEWVAAAGILAPYTAIATYPLTVDGAPSPSRYSLVSLDGSLLVIPTLELAYKPIEQVRIGVGFEAVAGSFQSTVVFSASPPDRVLAAPENPLYDALSELKVGPIFAPGGTAGIIAVPHPMVRVGVSGQLPFNISAPAKVMVQLPAASPFDGASQNGQDATVKFTLPGILRAGVEVRPLERLRVEAAYVREFWGAHDTISITPKNIALENVKGFPSPFAVSPINLVRGFKDTHSFRLGGQYTVDVVGYPVDLRAGVYFEPSAIPNGYVSPLTIDVDKVTLSAGVGLHVGPHWRFDMTYAHLFSSDVTVKPGDAKVPLVNPVQGNPTTPDYVNGGTYKVSAGVLGVGLRYAF